MKLFLKLTELQIQHRLRKLCAWIMFRTLVAQRRLGLDVHTNHSFETRTLTITIRVGESE
jgi:hypothetical protein